MKITKEFEKEIAPFFWVEHEESASVFLNVFGKIKVARKVTKS